MHALNLFPSRVPFVEPKTGSGLLTREALQAFRDLVARLDELGKGTTINLRAFGAKGDGSDESAFIQAASDYSSATGATIAVTEGTYVGKEIWIRSNAKFHGAGGILKIGTGSPGTGIGAYCFFRYDDAGASDTELIGLRFDAANMHNVGTGSPNGECAVIFSRLYYTPLKNFRIGFCTFRNIPVVADGINQRCHSLQITGGTGAVYGCDTDQCAGDIYNFNAGYFLVYGNKAQNGGDGGIAFNRDARGAIIGNFIYACDLGIGAGPENVTPAPHHTLLIDGNEIVGCGDGINMGWFGFAGYEGPRNVKVVGNTFDRCGRTGLRMDASASAFLAHMTITGNSFSKIGSTEIWTPGGSGVACSIVASGITITANTFEDGTGRHIAIGAGVKGAVIVANSFAQSDPLVPSILLNGLSKGVCSENVFSGMSTGIDDLSAAGNWHKFGNRNVGTGAAPTGLGPVIMGDDSAILEVRNGNGVQFKAGATTANVVNWLRAAGNAATGAPALIAEGADADVDLAFTPKGAGRVRVGTLVGSGDVPITGYIEIKDAGGTVRKLAVIA